jgi:NAD(P)-dependent dehydrogenase (short-subunit alcohol dehydrogenase family)
MNQFEGKVALITGGASGIGRATALAFARGGGRVVVGDLSVAGGGETVQMITDAGGEAIFVKTDVSRADDAEKLVNRAVEVYGRLDFALNNAGIGGHFGPTAEWPEAEWDRVINTNLKSVWLCMKYEILQMLRQQSGAIVNTAAAVVLRPIPGSCGYGASKAGIVQITKTAAAEYAGLGIRINAIAPGGTRTPMIEELFVKRPKSDRSPYPIGRVAEPEEIAEAALWLWSDASSYVVGALLAIDGGLSIT